MKAEIFACNSGTRPVAACGWEHLNIKQKQYISTADPSSFPSAWVLFHALQLVAGSTISQTLWDFSVFTSVKSLSERAVGQDVPLKVHLYLYCAKAFL